MGIFYNRKNTIAVGDTTFEIAKVLTLQQTVEFIYADAFVKMATENYKSSLLLNQILVISVIHY